MEKSKIGVVIGAIGGLVGAGVGGYLLYRYLFPPAPPPACREGEVRNVTYCPDGVTRKTWEECVNGKWVQRSQTCPSEAPPEEEIELKVVNVYNQPIPEGTKFVYGAKYDLYLGLFKNGIFQGRVDIECWHPKGILACYEMSPDGGCRVDTMAVGLMDVGETTQYTITIEPVGYESIDFTLTIVPLVLSGKVVDSDTKYGIANAKLMLEDRDHPSVRFKFTSGSDGSFSVSVYPMRANLYITADDYYPTAVYDLMGFTGGITANAASADGIISISYMNTMLKSAGCNMFSIPTSSILIDNNSVIWGTAKINTCVKSSDNSPYGLKNISTAYLSIMTPEYVQVSRVEVSTGGSSVVWDTTSIRNGKYTLSLILYATDGSNWIHQEKVVEVRN